MLFLQSFLPIVIYILLIVLIIIFIIIGIKLLNTMTKVEKIVNDVNDKIERVTPLFNILTYASDRVVGVVDKGFEFIDKLISKFLNKNKTIEMEDNENE